MASMGTKEIVKLRERIKELETALHEVVSTFEHDNWGWYYDCVLMANDAALALGLKKVRRDDGGYFIPGMPPKFVDEDSLPRKSNV